MRRRRGFTLLEVLIAIALLLALVGSMFGFLSGTVDARHRAQEHIQRQDAATRLIDGLEIDITHALVGDSAYGPGVRGDGTHLRILSRSVVFNLTMPGSPGEQADPLSDLQVSEYRFDPAALRVVGYRATATPGNSAQAPMQSLGGTIHKLRFRYHDGSAWRNSFDSLAADRLPLAIEVAVWFHLLPEDMDPEVDAFAPPSEGEAEEGEEAGQIPTQEPPSEALESASAEDPQADTVPPDRLRIIIVPDSEGAGSSPASTTDAPAAETETGAGP